MRSFFSLRLLSYKSERTKYVSEVFGVISGRPGQPDCLRSCNELPILCGIQTSLSQVFKHSQKGAAHQSIKAGDRNWRINDKTEQQTRRMWPVPGLIQAWASWKGVWDQGLILHFCLRPFELVTSKEKSLKKRRTEHWTHNHIIDHTAYKSVKQNKTKQKKQSLIFRFCAWANAAEFTASHSGLWCQVRRMTCRRWLLYLV